MDIISRFWSDNGKREAVVSLYCSDGHVPIAYYLLETRERGMLKETKPFDYLDKAEDAAENWVQNK